MRHDRSRSSQRILPISIAGLALAATAVAQTIAAPGGSRAPRMPRPAGDTIVAVSGFGANPSDGFDDTQSIQAALNALANGETLLFDRAGDYEVTRAASTWPGAPAGSSAALLQLSGKDDVTIRAVAGVRILLTGYDRGVTSARYPDVLRVEDCTNFVLKGAGSAGPMVFDMRGAKALNPSNEGLPFVQGELVALDVAARIATIRMSDPELFLPLGCTPYLWGAWQVVDDQPSVDADWIHGSVAAVTAPNAATQDVELRFNSATWTLPHAGWSIGNQVVALINDSATYAVIVRNCRGNVVLRDLLAHHLPGKFVQATQNQDMRVENVDVRPPLDSRLLSVARDGINAGAEHLVVRNCDLRFCGDDGIVVQGSSYGEVTSYDTTAKTFRVQPPTTINKWPSQATVGQHLVLLDRASMDAYPLELAEIQAVTWIQNYPTAPFAILEYTYTNESPGFAARLATGQGLTYNPWYSLVGAVVESCTVESDRGIGITVRAINTRITSCVVRKASTLGIHAGGGMVSAYPWFGAGAPPHYLRIEGCEIDACGGVDEHLALTGSIEIAVAAASLAGSTSACTYWIYPTYPTSTQAILDVTVAGNVVRNSRRAGLFVANVGGPIGIDVQNNWFIDCGAPDACHPEYDHAIVLESCGNGLVLGNQFPGCNNTVLANASPGVYIGP